MLSSPHGNLVEVSHFTISTSSAPLASGNHGFASFPTTAFGAAPFLAGHSTLQTGSAVAPACSGPGLVDIKHCRSFFFSLTSPFPHCAVRMKWNPRLSSIWWWTCKTTAWGSVLGVSLHCNSNKFGINGRYLGFSHVELITACSTHGDIFPFMVELQQLIQSFGEEVNKYKWNRF